MKRYFFIAWLLLICGQAFAQEIRNELIVPDILGYHTLKGDFHIHTVFSDGKVWPDVRVMEAWKEGLDVIAITDHIEYPNHLLPDDRNLPYEIAKTEAGKRNIILIKAAEITRKLPEECGHMNALFLTDVNKLVKTDYYDAIKEASAQGAFIFWNHPGWSAQQPDTTVWFDLYSRLINEHLMQGIEVVNWKRSFPVALTWCLQKNLTIMSNSDIHEPASFVYDYCKGDHRPMTLIFAKEKTPEGVKEALMEHRTVAYFKRGFYNQLMGREEFLKELFFKSVEIEQIQNNDKTLSIFLVNKSDLDFLLLKKNNDSRINYRKEYFLYGRSREEIDIQKVKPVKDQEIVLHFIINNLLAGVDEPIRVSIPVTQFLKP
jgi:3',5'-nucleoside bisphosphate phosphatase